MIDLAEARRRLAAETRPLETVELDVQSARGHVLAETVHADRDFPPTDRSAMDGFAVSSADLERPGVTLAVCGELRAGESAEGRRVEPGHAMRIFTGAVVPQGADAVVMVEDTEEDRDRGRVTFGVAASAGQHVRSRGSDLSQGQVVVAAGAALRTAEVAALTSVGHVRPRVVRRPRVAVLATGDEVVEPEVAPAPHQVRNSNAQTLMARLSEQGFATTYLGIAPDEPAALAERLRRGLVADVLLVTGGVSVGEYDLVGEALTGQGMRTVFHGVAIKPGKPILAGRAGGCLVFGLPGNPVSTFACYEIFVGPALRALMGIAEPGPRERRAVLTAPIKTRPGRRTYHLARLDDDGDGLRVAPVASTGSGDVLALARANGFAITEADVAAAAAGELVATLTW